MFSEAPKSPFQRVNSINIQILPSASQIPKFKPISANQEKGLNGANFITSEDNFVDDVWWSPGKFLAFSESHKNLPSWRSFFDSFINLKHFFWFKSISKKSGNRNGYLQIRKYSTHKIIFQIETMKNSTKQRLIKVAFKRFRPLSNFLHYSKLFWIHFHYDNV